MGKMKRIMVITLKKKKRYLFLYQLLAQQVSLLLLFGSKLFLLLVLLSGSSYMVLSLTQQVRALPAFPKHTNIPNYVTKDTKHSTPPPKKAH